MVCSLGKSFLLDILFLFSYTRRAMSMVKELLTWNAEPRSANYLVNTDPARIPAGGRDNPAKIPLSIPSPSSQDGIRDGIKMGSRLLSPLDFGIKKKISGKDFRRE